MRQLPCVVVPSNEDWPAVPISKTRPSCGTFTVTEAHSTNVVVPGSQTPPVVGSDLATATSFSATPPSASAFVAASARFAVSALPACFTESVGASALIWFLAMFFACFFSFLFRMLLIAVGAAMAVPANATIRAIAATIIAGDGRRLFGLVIETPFSLWSRSRPPYPGRSPSSKERSGVAHPLEDRDLANLGRLQVVPEDPAGPGMLALDLDHRARRCDQVHGEVVGGRLQVLAQDLNRVHGRRDGRVIVDLAGLDQEAVLEIREAAALADAAAAEIDGDGPAEHKVDGGEVLVGHHAAVTHGALDRRGLPQLLSGELARLEQAKRMDVAEPGDGHDQRLSLLQRHPAHVCLGRIRVDLENLGALPETVAAQLLGREFRTREVRDPALGAGKPRDALAIHGLPDVSADLILGPHQVREMVVGIASGILSGGPMRAATRKGGCETRCGKVPTALTRRILQKGKARPRRPSAREAEQIPQACNRPGGPAHLGAAAGRSRLGL